jgi:hypothetical protein
MPGGTLTGLPSAAPFRAPGGSLRSPPGNNPAVSVLTVPANPLR